MEANIQLIKKRRFYSKEFKQQLVSEFESGKFSVLQLHKALWNKLCNHFAYYINFYKKT